MQDSEFAHNFHTHTYRCKHAKGDVDDYCRSAVERGMETLGFSDHSAMPDDRWLQVRMSYEGLENYIDAIERAKSEYPSLRILQGMECEWVPKFKSWYADELLGERGFEYLVGAAHFFLDDENQWQGTYGGTNSAPALSQFARYTIDMMDSGLFDFIAHPDLFGNCYAQWDQAAASCAKDICQAAADLGVELEINALGIRKQTYKKADNPYPMYPWLPFWETAAECGATVIINSDAHRPEDLQALTSQAFSLMKQCGLSHIDVHEIGATHSP